MKKFSLILLSMVVLFVISSCATFPTRSQPGLYVNGWPGFTVSYPDGWRVKGPDPRFVSSLQWLLYCHIQL
ncbi:hypothetical protein ACFL2O_09390 [Thermodesulfobacteriota bacterium]